MAFTLDENIEAIRYREFSASTGHNTFHVVKAYPDNLVLGSTMTTLFIFAWLNDQFIILKQISLTNPLHDCVLSTSNNYIRAPIIYALMTDGTCTAYNLGKPNESKSIMVKPTRRNKKVYDMNAYMSTPQFEQGPVFDRSKAHLMTPQERRAVRKNPTSYDKLYNEYTVKQIMLQGSGLGKVQASIDDRFIYTGLQNLLILENNGRDFILNSKPNPVKPFIDIYLLKNSNELMVLEKNSGDLVKYDASFNELKRLKGSKAISGPGVEFSSFIYAGSDQKYLWYSGESTLAIVNPATFSSDMIQNFFGKAGEVTMPFAAIANNSFDKYIGVYWNLVGQDEQYLSVLFGNSGIMRKKVTDINPGLPVIYSLENSSSDANLFFAGCSNNRELQRGSAFIQAITCDKFVECIDQIELSPGDNVSRLTTGWLTRAADRDVLFAAVNQAIFVVEWTGTHFCILNYIDEIHTRLPVSVFSATPLRIYSTSQADSFVNKIEFKNS